jgi:hypothetical protein
MSLSSWNNITASVAAIQVFWAEREAIERWPSAAARDQLSSWKGKDY